MAKNNEDGTETQDSPDTPAPEQTPGGATLAAPAVRSADGSVQGEAVRVTSVPVEGREDDFQTFHKHDTTVPGGVYRVRGGVGHTVTIGGVTYTHVNAHGEPVSPDGKRIGPDGKEMSAEEVLAAQNQRLVAEVQAAAGLR